MPYFSDSESESYLLIRDQFEGTDEKQLDWTESMLDQLNVQRVIGMAISWKYGRTLQRKE